MGWRRSKRRRGASADLISGLCDDVLLRILELLPDAGDAVRTGALSRRWRGLWTRLSSLTFDSSSRRRLKSASSDKKFLDFVNNALAQRAMADDADLEHLAISFAIMSPPVGEQATKRLVRRLTEAAEDWIRHATQSTAKSFVLKLRLLNCYRGRGNVRVEHRLKQSMINLNDLPSSAKLESMHLELGGVRLHLPAAAVFSSLADLSLENIELVAGSGHLLARLLSSACCPSLQKLQLWNLRLPRLNKLLIEASALVELSISNGPIAGLETLKLKTPSLRIFHFEDYAYLGTLGISAPKLKELTFLCNQPDNIEVDGELPCVESLKVELGSHGYEDDDDDINDGSICLLRCCTSLTCLEVSLRVTTVCIQSTSYDMPPNSLKTKT
jgi:hypothetical protein